MNSEPFPCPKCGSKVYCKNGFNLGRQRYRCANCGYNYTVAIKGPDSELKKRIVYLYQEGLSHRAIGREVGQCGVTIKKWVEQIKQDGWD